MESYEFPQTNEEAYNKYPKLNWVYSRTHLLESQHISWSPFRTDELTSFVTPFTLDQSDTEFVHVGKHANHVWVEPMHGPSTHTECIIIKGEVKWMAHRDGSQFNTDIVGAIDLRISAFVTLYMKKFTGVVNFETVSNIIYSVDLHPTESMLDAYPVDAAKFFKKVYKKKVLAA